MRRLIIVLISILFLAITVVARAQTTQIPPTDFTNQTANPISQDQSAEQQDEVEGPVVPTPNVLPDLNYDDAQAPIESAILKHRGFAGVILVAQGGNILFKGAYGNIPGTSVAYTPNTPFLLASVTKQFTATLILKEVDKGTIKLSDPVRKFLPEATIYWDEHSQLVGKGRRATRKYYPALTIEDLLTHTSGLPDYMNLRLTSQERILSRIEKMRPRWEPGSRFYYSNSNYFLLGAIVERVTGQHLSDLVKTEITDPLQMTRSKMIPPWVQGAAELYSSDDEAQAVSPANYFAVGNMVSTADDLFKWERALIDDASVLGSDTLEDMLSPQPNTQHYYHAATSGLENVSYSRAHSHVQKVSDGYGFGERISEVDNKEIVWHTGHLNNHTTLIEHYMEDDITLIILTNHSNYNVIAMGNDIIDGVFHVPTVPAPVSGRRVRVHTHRRHIRAKRNKMVATRS